MRATSHTYQSIVFDEKVATRRVSGSKAKWLDWFGSPALNSTQSRATYRPTAAAAGLPRDALPASHTG